jgi:hypothetical protein
MSRRTTIHFPSVCDNCHERHPVSTDTWVNDFGDEFIEPGCDWNKLSGYAEPADRRYSINTRKRGWIGYRMTADDRALARDAEWEMITGGRTSSYYGVFSR